MRTRKDKTLTDKEIKELCKEDETQAEFYKRLGINHHTPESMLRYEAHSAKVLADIAPYYPKPNKQNMIKLNLYHDYYSKGKKKRQSI